MNVCVHVFEGQIQKGGCDRKKERKEQKEMRKVKKEMLIES